MRRICLALALGAMVWGCGARSSLPRPDADGNLAAGGDASTGTARPGEGGQGGASDGGGGLAEGGGGGTFVEECDPTLLFVYVVTAETELFKFDPRDNSFTRIGALDCPSVGQPFSMAVSRSGRAYSVYDNGELFRVNVKTAACQGTDWPPIPGGDDFNVFGMGYAIDDDGLGESLYVADIDFAAGARSAGLARLDTSTFELDYVGPFSANPGSAIELTSADDGQLYGYFINEVSPGGTLVRIDKHDGTILEQTPLPPPSSTASALAFAYWNGDFYVFTSNGAGSDVTRYRPATGEVGIIATLDRSIVGAGVTTCDPDEAGVP